MSALFTAVININLKLQKQNAREEKKYTQTSAINRLVTVTEHLYDMGRASNNLRRKSFRSCTWIKVVTLYGELRLIRNDLFLGRGSDCIIMSSWREEKMYNALSPLFILRMRGGPVSVGHPSVGHGSVDLCICAFVLSVSCKCWCACVCRCFSVFVWNLLDVCVQWPPPVR